MWQIEQRNQHRGKPPTQVNKSTNFHQLNTAGYQAGLHEIARQNVNMSQAFNPQSNNLIGSNYSPLVSPKD